MMRFVEVTESKPTIVDLTREDAVILNQLGRQLASNPAYRDHSDAGSASSSAPAVISCTSDGDSWKVYVRNAIGVIGLKDLQISVRPKIPLKHFLYILSFAKLWPRSIANATSVSESEDLLEVVATWFTTCLEAILRRDLIHDYANMRDELRAVRGNLDELKTAGNYYGGNLGFACRFEEFSVDTPINRILRAAAIRVAGNPRFTATLRRRAFRSVERLGAVSSLRNADIIATHDRRSAHYGDGLRLARLLLSSESRTIDSGNRQGWSFLIPTAGPVEDGIRALLSDALRPSFLVNKSAKRLFPGALTINADLVFQPPVAVGDVKYKIYPGEWQRPDLYQVVSFAVGYGVDRALVVSFPDGLAPALPTLHFGKIRSSNIVWPTSIGDTTLAGLTFSQSVAEWLEGAAHAV